MPCILDASRLKLFGVPAKRRRLPGLDTLRRTQEVAAFERLRARRPIPLTPEQREAFDSLAINRMVQGAFRYGDLIEQDRRGGNGYDNVGSAISRLLAYQESGNTEHLVDVANLMRVEFAVGHHPRKHFAPIDDGPHTRPQ